MILQARSKMDLSWPDKYFLLIYYSSDSETSLFEIGKIVSDLNKQEIADVINKKIDIDIF